MATVLRAEAVEGADKLLRLRVDIGSEQRTIFAGIRQSYRPADLIGKQVWWPICSPQDALWR